MKRRLQLIARKYALPVFGALALVFGLALSFTPVAAQSSSGWATPTPTPLPSTWIPRCEHALDQIVGINQAEFYSGQVAYCVQTLQYAYSNGASLNVASLQVVRHWEYRFHFNDSSYIAGYAMAELLRPSYI